MKPPIPRIGIPRRLVEKFLREMVPLVKETVELFEENANSDGLTPRLRAYIARFQVESWAEAYEDVGLFLILQIGALSALDQPPPVLLNLPKIESLAEAQAFADSMWDACEHILDEFSDDDLAFIDHDEAEPWTPASHVEDGKPISRQAVLLTIMLVVVFNYFSCMVHRKSLFQLVAEAKGGSPGAFLKAVQTDKRCLTDIAYFRERIEEATRTADLKFLRKVMRHQQKPAFQSGTKLTGLYLIFSLLDTICVLDAYAEDMEKFAELCQSLGVYGPADEAVDVESFARTFRRFKAEYQSLNPKSKIVFFVKDTN
jgi:hypothetical protein